jgi:hypothetical protein
MRLGGGKASPPIFLEGLMRLLLFFLLVLAGEAKAGEVITECPITKHDNQNVILVGGQAFPDGSPSSSTTPDAIFIKNGLKHIFHNYIGDDVSGAVLSCNYSDRIDIIIPITGMMRTCTLLVRAISSDRLIIDEYIRIWCVSETVK